MLTPLQRDHQHREIAVESAWQLVMALVRMVERRRVERTRRQGRLELQAKSERGVGESLLTKAKS